MPKINRLIRWKGQFWLIVSEISIHGCVASWPGSEEEPVAEKAAYLMVAQRQIGRQDRARVLMFPSRTYFQ